MYAVSVILGRVNAPSAQWLSDPILPGSARTGDQPIS